MAKPLTLTPEWLNLFDAVRPVSRKSEIYSRRLWLPQTFDRPVFGWAHAVVLLAATDVRCCSGHPDRCQSMALLGFKREPCADPAPGATRLSSRPGPHR